MSKYIVLGIIMILTACSPSEQAIQTVVVETETERPTATSIATVVSEPTATNMPDPTVASTPELSPTLDLRLIQEDPKNYLLEIDDLPQEAQYYLPNAEAIRPHRNEDLIATWEKSFGLAYLEATGRVDAWIALYARGSSAIQAPEEVFCDTIMFETAAGAHFALFDNPIGQLGGFEELDVQVNLGDGTRVWIRRDMQSNGNYKVDLLVEFIYRNYEVRLVGSGREDDVTLGFMIEVAESVLARLEAAPLTNP